MFAFLLAQTIAASSPLSGWWYLGDMGIKPYRSVIYASLETRQVESDVARIWTWTIDETQSASGRESVKTLWENRCATGQQRTLMIVGYDKTEQPTGSVNRPSEWNFVVPDSNGAKIFRLACSGDSYGMVPVLKQQGSPADLARELFQGE